MGGCKLVRVMLERGPLSPLFRGGRLEWGMRRASTGAPKEGLHGLFFGLRILGSSCFTHTGPTRPIGPSPARPPGELGFALQFYCLKLCFEPKNEAGSWKPCWTALAMAGNGGREQAMLKWTSYLPDSV
eukprot:748400-Hanusia_phi.AAC.13